MFCFEKRSFLPFASSICRGGPGVDVASAGICSDTPATRSGVTLEGGGTSVGDAVTPTPTAAADGMTLEASRAMVAAPAEGETVMSAAGVAVAAEGTMVPLSTLSTSLSNRAWSSRSFSARSLLSLLTCVNAGNERQ
jgi:hypothetical protein